jgi:hypothetical protein
MTRAVLRKSLRAAEIFGVSSMKSILETATKKTEKQGRKT